MKAHIIYMNFLKPNGIGLNIGGIETYIRNLAGVLDSLNYEVHIYQRGDVVFNKTFEKYYVHGIVRKNIHTFKFDIFNACALRCDATSDLVIFASEEFIINKKGYNTLCIQHGISWDIPKGPLSKLSYIKAYFRKALNAWIRINRANKVKTMVCVDYNFVNWFRALTAYPKTNLKVVPNFTSIPDGDIFTCKDSDIINIIFARRFQPYRGTLIFAGAIKRILSEYVNVSVTFAGEGPDEEYLKNQFQGEKRVEFIKYTSDQSLGIHSTKHIAVVPTIGSEGTSLSLLEAMAAGCAVIATNVGGLTNILIDHYNGLLINPDEDSIYFAIKEYLDNKEMMDKIAHRGYETAVKAFSLSRWKESWIKIIEGTKQ